MAWKVPTLARVANDWSMNTDTMGVYGNYYLKRAIVAQLGLGANLPEDAIYPLNLGDETGKPLDGANKYTLHFEKGATPPVECLLVGHPLRRGRLSGRQQPQPLCGQQLDAVQVQCRRLARSLFPERKPRQGQGGQLAASPERARFNLTMRLYGPKADALTGKWNPPAVMEVHGLPSITAQ